MIWRKRFGVELTPEVDSAHLPDNVVAALMAGDDPGNQAIQQFACAALALPPGPDLNHLDNADKMRVLDAFLALIDLVRFEAMCRLGWVEDFKLRTRPVVELALDPAEAGEGFTKGLPALTINHPDYEAFVHTPEMERAVLVRRSIPTAIQAFGRRYGNRP